MAARHLKQPPDSDEGTTWLEMVSVAGRPFPEQGIDRVGGDLPKELELSRVDAKGTWLIFGKRLYSASIANFELDHDHIDHVLSSDLIAIQFIVDGSFDFLLEHGGRYNLKGGRGVVLICPPGTRLHRHMHAGPAVRYIGVTMSISQLELEFGVDKSALRPELRALADGSLREPIALEFHMTQEQRQAAEALLYPKLNGRLNDIYIESKLNELACLSIPWLLLKGPHGRRMSSLQDRLGQALERAAMLMAADVSRQPSIQEICQQVGLNRNKLSAGFRSRFGMTPLAYGKQLRLRRAAELMGSSTLSVFEVSQEAGFTSQSSFARAFKEEFGLSPRSYRANPPPTIGS